MMLGGMLAVHDESGGETIERDGKLSRRFYGMSSETAMQKYAGGVAKHRASEGKEVLRPARGPVCAQPAPILARASSGTHRIAPLWCAPRHN